MDHPNERSDDLTKLRYLQYRYSTLPYSPDRAALNREYVLLADRLSLPRMQVLGRYDLIWAYTMGDDPARSLPVCEEFFSLLDRYPGILGDQEGTCSVSAAMVAFYAAAALPQIPLDQCRLLLDQFREAVRRAHLGERLFHMHACRFALMTGDRSGAADHLAHFQAAPRDEISDCAACEASNVAEYLLQLGRREEALELLRPVLEQRLICEQQPWDILGVLIHDALDRGDLEGARGYGRRLLSRPVLTPSDLPWAGAMLRLEGADPGGWAAPELLGSCLSQTAGLWDQELLFRFFSGAVPYCAHLSRTCLQLRLSLPDRFPLYREDGIYDPATLLDWCRGQAGEIARRFDARNGNDQYGLCLSKRLTPGAPA